MDDLKTERSFDSQAYAMKSVSKLCVIQKISQRIDNRYSTINNNRFISGFSSPFCYFFSGIALSRISVSKYFSAEAESISSVPQ